MVDAEMLTQKQMKETIDRAFDETNPQLFRQSYHNVTHDVTMNDLVGYTFSDIMHDWVMMRYDFGPEDGTVIRYKRALEEIEDTFTRSN